MSVSTPTRTTRLVDRLSERFASTTSRRGFLVRSALGATALTVAPTRFVFRPGTAYAAICGCSGSSCACGSLCCDGYTEMCCTLTGVNRCPGGTVPAGWWKADGTSFCGGGARYYIDCNVAPGQNPCSCGCAQGDCGNRKACCTNFRYGQCHQEIPSVGPIMCRVITCTPPWMFDSTCTTDPLVDNATGSHDRPCLHLPVGNLDQVVMQGANRMRVVGWAIDPDTAGPIDVDLYLDGTLVARVRADANRQDIANAFPGLGPAHGFDVTLDASGTTMCMYGINQGPGSTNPLLACRPVNHNPFGALDSVTMEAAASVRVTGWAVDPDSTNPVDVHIYADNSLVSIVRADGQRSDVAAALPAFGAFHGFDVSIQAQGASTVCAYAINVGPGSTNSLLGCRPVPHLPFGSVDQVSIVPNAGIRVRGWVVDPDVTSATDVHVYADGNFAAVVRADGDRPDVAAAYPGYGSAHGFDAVIDVPSASTICVYGINRGIGTTNPLLGCAQLDHNPFGSFDGASATAGGARVFGWAIDPDSTESIDVHVYADGRFAAVLHANASRPDVGSALPAYGPAHGFDGVVSLPAGSHDLCVFAINTGPGRTNPVLGCRRVVV